MGTLDILRAYIIASGMSYLELDAAADLKPGTTNAFLRHGTLDQTVRMGETLRKIAAAVGMPLNELQEEAVADQPSMVAETEGVRAYGAE